MSETKDATLLAAAQTAPLEVLVVSAAEAAKLYSEILAAIRTTDDIRFKLLGLVPLVSGLANGGLTVLGKSGFDPVSIVLLSALGAGITHCLFRWEQRNIASCKHWWKKLTFVERQLGFKELSGRPDAPLVNGRRWGKTEAEAWIYRLAAIAWLVPIVTVVSRSFMGGSLARDG